MNVPPLITVFLEFENMMATPITAVANQLEDQWDRIIPSEIASDRGDGKEQEQEF